MQEMENAGTGGSIPKGASGPAVTVNAASIKAAPAQFTLMDIIFIFVHSENVFLIANALQLKHYIRIKKEKA
jgi:hypothetical protein